MPKKGKSDPVILDSDRSCKFEKDGHRVDVCIYRQEHETEWTLEVVDAHGTSTVWGERFPTDDAAWDAFMKTIGEEGIEHLIEPIERLSFN